MNLIFIYGPPAAGKLTVATELEKLTGYKLLDNHLSTDYLQVVFPRTNPEFEDARRDLSRKIRLEVYQAAAVHGVDLIITFAPLGSGGFDFMRSVRKAVENAGGNIRFVQLLPNQDEILKRVRNESRRPTKIVDEDTWHTLMDGHKEAFTAFPDVEHLTIDNSDMEPGDVARLIVEHYTLT
jgi:shikimate kinase